MEQYLGSSEYLDWEHPLVAAKAAEIADGSHSDEVVAKRCFEFVRDSIQHSWDYRKNPVTCKASEVLTHGTGYCYAKSHLLAALLRANSIPAGLCYQRLAVGTEGPPFCLHGLNAVYLKNHGWYRIDARGNSRVWPLNLARQQRGLPPQLLRLRKEISRRFGLNHFR